MEISEYVTIFKDLMLSFAALVTAYVAYTGLKKWKVEISLKARFEAARSLVKCTYKLRDEISYFRSPFISPNEFPSNYSPDSRKRTNEDNGNAWNHLYQQRWKPLLSAFQEFEANALEAEALFGGSIREKTKGITHCVKVLENNTRLIVRDKFEGGSYLASRNCLEKVNNIMHDSGLPGAESNQFTQKVAIAIENVESVIRPHLLSNHTHS